MGRISGPFGVKGWVKLQPFTKSPQSLLDYKEWWIEGEQGWEALKVERAQVQNDAVGAKLAGCEDRDQAALFRGRQVAVPREAFPEAGENEFYWADLIGAKVVNTQDEDLGKVSEVFETGANDVLVVKQGSTERLIPFIEQVVREVDLAKRVIRVEWGADY